MLKKSLCFTALAVLSISNASILKANARSKAIFSTAQLIQMAAGVSLLNTGYDFYNMKKRLPMPLPAPKKLQERPFWRDLSKVTQCEGPSEYRYY